MRNKLTGSRSVLYMSPAHLRYNFKLPAPIVTLLSRKFTRSLSVLYTAPEHLHHSFILSAVTVPLYVQLVRVEAAEQHHKAMVRDNSIKRAPETKASLARVEAGLDITSLARDGGKTSHEETDLPNFIGQILSRYQDLVVHKIERDVKSRALATVNEEVSLRHNQARERLRLMESDVQQEVQAITDLATEGIFEMVRDEIEDVFGQLGGRLERLLEGPETGILNPASESTQKELERARDLSGDEKAAVKESGRSGRELEAEATEPEYHDIDEHSCPRDMPESPTPVSDSAVYTGTVRLQVNEHESPRQVVQFLGALRQRSDLHVVQLVGNKKGGVEIWLVLRVPLHLKEALLAMTGVSQVDTDRRLAWSSGEPRLKVGLGQAALAN